MTLMTWLRYRLTLHPRSHHHPAGTADATRRCQTDDKADYRTWLLGEQLKFRVAHAH